MRYIRGNFNFKDKDYKIYYFESLSKYKLKKWHESNMTKFHQEMWDNGNLIFDFKKKLIDKFCSENFDELVKYTLFAKHLLEFNYTMIPYKKERLFTQVDIGLDMLEEEHELIIGYFRGIGLSIAVPLNKPDIIKFIDNNAPKQVYRIVKRLC